MGMRMTAAFGLALAVVGMSAESQPQAPAPEKFDVISVKPSSHAGTRDGTITVRPGSFEAGKFSAINANVMTFIQIAFASEGFAAIEGAPAWATRARFDVDARAGADSLSPTQRETMLRQLLKERFRMTTHVEQRMVKAYDLVLARPDSRLGRNLRPSSQNCTATPRPETCGIRYDSPVNGATRLRVGGLPIAALVDRIRDKVKAPVVDRTGLDGLFDAELTMAASDDSRDVAPDVFAAVQEQLGLRLVERRVERDVLVIDHLERPSEN
jgi:uncharacterized protein (TIGR03435 family)